MLAQLTIQNVFREVFDDDSLIVTPEMRCEEIEGWDSVAQVKLVLTIEEAFGIQFSENEVSSIRSVGGFLKCIEQRRARAA